MTWWPFIRKRAKRPPAAASQPEANLGDRPADEFHALFAQLHEAEAQLEKGSAELEAQFLTTGSTLESLVGLGDLFVNQVEKLVGLATGKECDSSVFSSAITLIEQCTQFLVTCLDETTRMLRLLRDYNAQIEYLLGVEAELHRAMMPLRFVQTLFKVESAPLGEGVQQMFSALTQEIESLHGQASEIFGTKFKQLEQTHRTIGQVISQLDHQARSLQEVTATHRKHVESALGNLKREMSSNQEREVRLGRLSKALASEVQQVVLGLQFQDIVSQKLKHVTSALPELEEKFSAFQNAPVPSAATEPLQFIHQSCRLEAGQLEAARQEIVNAEAAIKDGVQRVLSHLAEVDSHCLSLVEFKLLTTSFDGMVQVLIETIDEVRALVAATVAGVAQAYDLLHPLGSLASNLTAFVRGMSARIHLIGLNAQVQAAQAALDRRGVGLEVLSARTSEISTETNRIGEQAAVQLDALAAGLAESVKALGRLRAAGLNQQNVLETQGRQEEQLLHAFRDRALESLRSIGAALDDIRSQAQQILDTVEFTPFHQGVLPGLREPLVAMAEAAERWLVSQGSAVASTNLIQASKRGYTMESERKVFDSLVAADQSSNSQSESVTSTDVELFSETTPTPATTPALASTPAVPETQHPTPGPAATGELGANVDLF